MPPLLRLSVLGGTSLSGVSGAQAAHVLARPKQLALLTYLALAQPGAFLRRDALCALLWPEADTERSRNSLRQAVHRLRRVLGPDALVSRGDQDIRLEHERVACDAAEFLAHATAGRHQQALSVYAGDLLPAFFADDAAGFEEWLEAERGRLRGLAERSAWALAEAAERAGAAADAARWGRRAAELAPLDEVAVRRLMELLARLGDRAAALRAYDDYAQRLRREFQTEPSPPTRDVAAAIRRTVASEPLPVAANLSAVAAAPADAHARSLAATPWRTGWSARRASLLYVAGALTILAIAGLWSRERSETPALDPTLVAVMPFRVAGADTSLRFLSEGMLDLVSVELTGEAGFKAADPRATAAAWRAASDDGGGASAPRRAAETLGGGRVLTGAVIGHPDRLVLTATLADTRGGAVQATATVAGPLDSLPRLVDRLMAGLLAGEWDRSNVALARRASQHPEALRAYIEGRTAYRHGHYPEAVRALHRAVALDSNFAEAALYLADAEVWAADSALDSTFALAWRLRPRLGAADRAYADGLLPEGLKNQTPPSAQERAAAWERAIALDPTRPEAWYELGDQLFHYGLFIDSAHAAARARAAFDRAVALDSSYAAPLAHLLQLAIREGDLRAAGRYARILFAADSGADDADFLRWRYALAIGDQAALAALRARMPTMTAGSLLRIALWSVVDGVGLDDGRRAADLLAHPDGVPFASLATDVALGRFRSALAALVMMFPLARADTTASLAELSVLDDGAWSPPTARSPQAASGVALWDTWNGAPCTKAQRRQFQATPATLDVQAMAALCAVTAHDAGALRLVERVDSASTAARNQRTGPSNQVVLARAYELLGQPARALAVLRRRPYEQWWTPRHLAQSLRMEGRLAAQVGDTAGAIAAYRRYLVLRSDPDPDLIPKTDTVRAALAALHPAR